MFEVRIMVEDSKLHKVLWALDGMIVGMPQMLPVRNAVPSKDKKQVKEKSHGGLTMEFYNGLEGDFTWVDAASVMEKIGGARASTSSYLTRLMAAGKIARTGIGKYKVL
jgi:hypothetical protein